MGGCVCTDDDLNATSGDVPRGRGDMERPEHPIRCMAPMLAHVYRHGVGRRLSVAVRLARVAAQCSLWNDAVRQRDGGRVAHVGGGDGSSRRFVSVCGGFGISLIR